MSPILEKISDEVKNIRSSNYPICPILLNRWSPRAMSGKPVAKEQLMSLFEAARWAPSSYNNQPWRFIYAHRDTPEWGTFLDLLVEQNKMWADKAGVLIVLAAKKTFERKPGARCRLRAFRCFR